jgi:dipeptidyl aminopeptidase/acylaminoacyl peptidase
MGRRLILPVLTFLVFIVSAGLVILFAKGYHYFPKTGTLEKTGLLVATSTPNGASIYINGHLTDATNATIKLVPGTYEIEIAKEGYTTWKKEVKVAPEFVTTTNVNLFPAIPELRPLTATSVKNPTLSPDGQKIAFIVPENASFKKAGIWVLNMVNRPFGFGRTTARQVVADTPWQKFSEAKISWSPDSRSLLASFDEGETIFLLNPEASVASQEPKNITATLPLPQKEWEEEEETNSQQRLIILPPNLQEIATTAALARWSPDEKRLLYQIEKEVAKVFDPKWEEFPPETRNKEQEVRDKKGKTFELPEALDYLWLPEAESKHVILVEEGQISIIESEGTNKMIVFGGEFEENFVAPWPDGSKLVISASLNKPAGVAPNLYTINLR